MFHRARDLHCKTEQLHFGHVMMPWGSPLDLMKLRCGPAPDPLLPSALYIDSGAPHPRRGHFVSMEQENTWTKVYGGGVQSISTDHCSPRPAVSVQNAVHMPAFGSSRSASSCASVSLCCFGFGNHWPKVSVPVAIILQPTLVPPSWGEGGVALIVGFQEEIVLSVHVGQRYLVGESGTLVPLPTGAALAPWHPSRAGTSMLHTKYFQHRQVWGVLTTDVGRVMFLCVLGGRGAQVCGVVWGYCSCNPLDSTRGGGWDIDIHFLLVLAELRLDVCS